MSNSNDPDMEAFRQKLDAAKDAIDGWEHKDKDFLASVTEIAACSLCFLAGRDPQPTHYLIMLCPHPGGSVAVYRAAEHLQHGKPGEVAAPLHLDTKIVTDNTAVVDTVVGLLNNIMGGGVRHERT